MSTDNILWILYYFIYFASVPDALAFFFDTLVDVFFFIISSVILNIMDL